MWYTKYMSALGENSNLSDDLYNRISTSIKNLEHGREPQISVVIIAYNEQSRLTACLWSLSEMASERSIEVIVVDNNSKDNTAEIIRRCGAKYVWQPLQGVGHARQAGLDMARGEIILSADADTLYPITYADAMYDALSDKSLSCVFTSYWFYEDGAKSRGALARYSRMRDFALWLRSFKRPELAVGGAAMAFRRQDALEVGWKTDIKRGEDGAMLLGLKRLGRARILLNKKVRVRSTSRTLDADGSMGSMIGKRVKRELRRFGAYFKRKNHYVDKDYNKMNNE